MQDIWRKLRRWGKLKTLPTNLGSFGSRPLSAVFDYLGKDRSISVLLTPHLSDYEAYSAVAGYKFEGYFLKYGLYNSGFYVLKNDQRTYQFLEWLKIKLFEKGFFSYS